MWSRELCLAHASDERLHMIWEESSRLPVAAKQRGWLWIVFGTSANNAGMTMSRWNGPGNPSVFANGGLFGESFRTLINQSAPCLNLDHKSRLPGPLNRHSFERESSVLFPEKLHKRGEHLTACKSSNNSSFSPLPTLSISPSSFLSLVLQGKYANHFG